MKFKAVYRNIRRSVRYVRINRKYKDRLFRMIFHDKKELLTLYNAINGTEYENPEDLTVITLGDVIYMGMKNDISFLIGSFMNLYEHQSSWNPNMPLRGFLYLADTIRGYVESRELDIYGSKLVMLPTPQYIIFYNGDKEQPDREELLLSDSFMVKTGEPPVLECRATVLNINKGHNQDIMNRCRCLADYAAFIQMVKDNLKQGMRLIHAVEKAINECVEKEILADVLRKNRAEVMDVLLTTYNEKQHKKTLQREAKEEGREEGRSRINELNRRLLADGREEELKKAVLDEEYQKKLLKEYGL